MKSNQALVELVHKLRKEHQNSPTPKNLKNARLADSLVKKVSGGKKGEFEFFARWTRAAA